MVGPSWIQEMRRCRSTLKVLRSLAPPSTPRGEVTQPESQVSFALAAGWGSASQTRGDETLGAF